MNVQLDSTLIVQVTMQLDEAVDIVNAIERLNGYASPGLEDLRTALLAGLVSWNSALSAKPPDYDSPAGAGEAVEASRG